MSNQIKLTIIAALIVLISAFSFDNAQAQTVHRRHVTVRHNYHRGPVRTRVVVRHRPVRRTRVIVRHRPGHRSRVTTRTVIHR